MRRRSFEAAGALVLTTLLSLGGVACSGASTEANLAAIARQLASLPGVQLQFGPNGDTIGTWDKHLPDGEEVALSLETRDVTGDDALKLDPSDVDDIQLLVHLPGETLPDASIPSWGLDLNEAAPNGWWDTTYFENVSVSKRGTVEAVGDGFVEENPGTYGTQTINSSTAASSLQRQIENETAAVVNDVVHNRNLPNGLPDIQTS